MIYFPQLIVGKSITDLDNTVCESIDGNVLCRIYTQTLLPYNSYKIIGILLKKILTSK